MLYLKNTRLKKKILFVLLCFFSMIWAQKTAIECVAFRAGFDNFPLLGNETITLTSGDFYTLFRVVKNGEK